MTKRVMIIGEEYLAEKIKAVIKENKLDLKVVDYWEYTPRDNNDRIKREELINILPLELKDEKIDTVIFAVEQNVSNWFGNDTIPSYIKKYDFNDFINRFNKNQKRILYIATNSDLGGISNYLLELIKRLQYNITPYFTMNSEGYLSDELAKLGYKDNCYFIPMTNSTTDILTHIKSNIKTFFLILKLRPDFIHCNATTGGIVGKICGFLTRKPVIHTIHGCPFTDGIAPKKQKFYRKLEHIMSYLTTKTICVCEYDRQLEFGVFPKKFHSKLVTVLNGMSDTELRKEYKTENEDLNIVMISRFAPQKDPYTLIEAVNELTQQEGLNINLNLYGYGPELEQVKENIYSCGNERIQFKGETKNPSEVIIQNDVYALISNWEGLPLGIIEAMRAGLPVIACNVGGNSEAVVDNENGFIIPAKNKEILKEKIRKLYYDRSLLSQLGQKSRELYEQNFTAEKMAEQTFKVYEEILWKK